MKQLPNSTAFRQAAASDTVDPLANVRIVNVEYDDLNPDRYVGGTYIGVVVKRIDNRMKVVFDYETDEDEIACLTPHGRNRWIDKTGVLSSRLRM